MRCGVAESVARVCNTVSDHCWHGIGNLLARSVLYKTLAVLAAAYPSDVILVSHYHTDFSALIDPLIQKVLFVFFPPLAQPS